MIFYFFCLYFNPSLLKKTCWINHSDCTGISNINISNRIHCNTIWWIKLSQSFLSITSSLSSTSSNRLNISFFRFFLAFLILMINSIYLTKLTWLLTWLVHYSDSIIPIISNNQIFCGRIEINSLRTIKIWLISKSILKTALYTSSNCAQICVRVRVERKGK